MWSPITRFFITCFGYYLAIFRCGYKYRVPRLRMWWTIIAETCCEKTCNRRSHKIYKLRWWYNKNHPFDYNATGCTPPTLKLSTWYIKSAVDETPLNVATKYMKTYFSCNRLQRCNVTEPCRESIKCNPHLIGRFRNSHFSNIFLSPFCLPLGALRDVSLSKFLSSVLIYVSSPLTPH
jgi:hypothetical protein